MNNGRWPIWAALILATLGPTGPVPANAQTLDSTEVANSFDQDLYHNYQTHAWTNLDDLVRDYEANLAFWMPIAPPGTNFSEWIQSGTRPLVLVATNQLPRDFLDNLTTWRNDGVTVHPIFVIEDPATRNRIVYNAGGQAIASLPPPAGYDALRYFRRLYPDFDQWGWSSAELAESAAPYDSARLTVRYDLILDDDLVTMLLRRAVVNAAAQQAAATNLVATRNVLGGHMSMNSMQYTPALSNIVIGAVTYDTNGITLEIGFPADMAGGIDVFSCTNLDAFQATTWRWAATNLSTSGGSPLQWTDATASNTNGLSWFYAVGDSGLDSDGDGLSDAQEMYLHHTDPHNADSDGDGLPDGWEIRYGLNPLLNDAGGDLDGDGVSNLTEYLQGRDPTKGAVADTSGQVGLQIYTRLE